MDITINDIKHRNFSLSPSMYTKGSIIHDGIPISNFLSKSQELKHGEDLPSKVRQRLTQKEIFNHQVPYMFLRTSGVTSYSSIPVLNTDSLNQTSKTNFDSQDLQKGDLIVSKDGNVGESAILDKDYPNTMLCGGLWHPKFKDNASKLLVFAYMKSNRYHSQLISLVPRGSTLRHAGKKVFRIKMPEKMIANFKNNLIKLAYELIKNDTQIKFTYLHIMNLIEGQFKIKKLVKSYDNSSILNISNLRASSRLDSNFYTNLMKIYQRICHKYDAKTLSQLGYNNPRGQNLQKSNIGRSKISQNNFPGGILTIRPRDISIYGFPIKYEYLSNRHQLKILHAGDILFGAEGTYRSFIIPNGIKAISNIHGIMIRQIRHNNTNDISSRSIAIKYLLDYYRDIGILDCISTGSHGGSLAQTYWKYIKFPKLNNKLLSKLKELYQHSLILWKNQISNVNKLNRIINKY